jgi:hypothetical protein
MVNARSILKACLVVFVLGVAAGIVSPHPGGAPATAQIVIEPINGGGPTGSACSGKAPACQSCTGLWCTWTCSGARWCGQSNSSCAIWGGACSTSGGSGISL